MALTDFKPKQRADRDVTTFSEFTGLRNDTTPDRFLQNDLAVADNVVLDDARALARRAGYTLKLPGAAHSVWASGADALYAVGKALYRLDAALAPTNLTNLLSGAALSYARGGDTVYFSNGVNTGVALSGATRTWGLEVPAVLATPKAGDLVPGAYLFSATYLRSDGQESGAEHFDPMPMAAGQGVTLTVPPSHDPDVAAVRFYMSTPNGEVLYHVGSVAANGGAFAPTAADIAAMNEPLATQFMGPAPAGQLIAYFKGRMFVAVGAVLYVSQPFGYELFDLRDYVLLDGPITMLAPFEDSGVSGFFIGTTNSIGLLMGDAPDDFKYVPKVHYGAVQGTLAYVDGALYTDGGLGARRLPTWLSTQGICIGTPGMSITNLTRERYTFTVGGAGAALYDAESSQFVVTLGSGHALALNTRTLTLTTFSNYPFTSMARAFGRNVGVSGTGLHELVGDTDAGAPIAARVTFATTDFGSSFVKAIERLYAGHHSKADMQLGASVDDAVAVSYTLPASTADNLTQRVKLGKGLTGRYWSFTLSNVAGADFSLDTLDIKSSRLERRVNGRA